MKRFRTYILAISVLAVFILSSYRTALSDDKPDNKQQLTKLDKQIDQQAQKMLAEGRQIFRFDTFGDEAFWGDTLKLHQAIKGAQLGGVGPGVSPKTALDVGLKIDVDALPGNLVSQLRRGRVDLNDPAVTVELLRLDAVIGVTGIFSGNDLSSVGIQCALCHATVDDSLASGIGHRLDGWANRDLNVGAIISLAPDLSALTTLLEVSDDTVRKVLASWGPGKYDAELILDGKAFRPDGKTAATLLPPVFGLAGVNLHTWTGWGSVPYWNVSVAVLQMHGKGTFFDPRLKDEEQFPVAARAGLDNVRSDTDLVSAKLPALHLYQLAIPAPTAPEGSFNASAAANGKQIFEAKGQCATCHVPPTYSEPGWSMHTGEEIGIDDFQANRSPNKRYRTAPLKGLWTHTKGGFYHDGRFATLLDVVNHYNGHLGLGLSEQEKTELVEYLKSI